MTFGSAPAWTQDAIDCVRKLWRGGMTAQQIAATMNLPFNAVQAKLRSVGENGATRGTEVVVAATRGWSAADDKVLHTLWGEGKPASQIAVKLGRSRNAVIGRLHRLKAQGRPEKAVVTPVQPASPPMAAKPAAAVPKPPALAPSARRAALSVRHDIDIVSALTTEPTRPPVERPSPVRSEDLPDRACPAIVTFDGLRCGVPREHGSNWCSEHRKKYTQPTAGRVLSVRTPAHQHRGNQND